MPTTRLLIALLALTPLTEGAAQRATAQPGARVRVWAPGLGITRQVGTLVRVDADSVVLRRLAVPRDSVTRLEVSRGHASPAKGAVYGAATLGVVGLFTGLAMTSSCQGSGFQFFCGAGADFVVAATVVGAASGAVAGLVIGSIVSVVGGERWQPAATRMAQVIMVRPAGDSRLALGVSLTF